MWFWILFCPPVYFILKGKIVACVISAILMLGATVFLFVFPPLGLIIGFCAVGWAAADYRKREQTKFIKEQAAEIAKAMGKSS